MGLTGGTGAGKSTVATRFAELGAVVVDADRLAREVVAPGTPGLAAVTAEFGPSVLDAAGSLDRAALARLVFADADRRRELEAITHPLIAARTGELVATAPRDAVLVHDVPLLVEKGMGAAYHLVVVVDAPEEVRVARLAGRGMVPDDARVRVRSQATDAERRAAADVLLDNAGAVADVHAAVDALWHDRLVPFERNVRNGEPAPRPEHVQVVSADPAWFPQAARLRSRVLRAVGDDAISVDHIGSTSVPGLSAKDVLDVQLVVDDLDTADRAGPALGAIGLVRREGDWWDSGTRLPKRVHGACDPARAVNLHVRTAASPAVREALLFRDWLRAHGGERNAYAAVKATATSDDIDGYMDAKAPWIRAALDRAEAWAAATAWAGGPG